MNNYKIRHKMSSPYHPQANGQVEVTNREIEEILTKTVQLHKKDWSSRLPEAVWAYRTTWKTTTGFTPFELLYGKTTMLPIEFQHKTLRTTLQLNIDISEAQKECLLQLSALDEIRKASLQHTEAIQQQRKKWYDHHIRTKQFSVGD